MSEWTERDQDRIETHLWNSDLPRSHVERALACVRLCAGHADLAKVHVISNESHAALLADFVTAKAELATLREQLSERTKERDGLHDELNRIAGIFGVTLSIGASQHYIYPLVQDRVQKLREQLAAREADNKRLLGELSGIAYMAKRNGAKYLTIAIREKAELAIARQEGGAP